MKADLSFPTCYAPVQRRSVLPTFWFNCSSEDDPVKPARATLSAVSSAALLLTVLLTSCGGGTDTSGGPPPSSDTFKPYSAVTDTRSGAFLQQTDGSYVIPVN